jgi:hypothetical protein
MSCIKIAEEPKSEVVEILRSLLERLTDAVCYAA